MDTLIIIGILLAIAATIVLYIKVMPKRYDGKLGNKFLQFLHDFFNFKTFYIEALTKFVFVLLTCACIFVGFLLLFGKIEYYGYFGATFQQSTFLYGLGLMILGPLVLRVTYEFVMMAILLVQNVIARDEKSRTFSSNSQRSHILRTSSRSRRLILSSIVSLAVSLKWTRTI